MCDDDTSGGLEVRTLGDDDKFGGLEVHPLGDHEDKFGSFEVYTLFVKMISLEVWRYTRCV